MADKTVVGGSSVTAGQLKDFFRQIDDGSIGHEEMDAILAHRFEKSLRALIAACKFDWVNPNIEKHFTLELVRRERKVFHFDRTVSSKEAEGLMKAEGWDPANLAELLDYAKNEWNGKGWVIALGSSALLGGYYCGVPGLCRYGAERGLCLGWVGPRLGSRRSVPRRAQLSTVVLVPRACPGELGPLDPSPRVSLLARGVSFRYTTNGKWKIQGYGFG